jgi:hypothetical protein
MVWWLVIHYRPNHPHHNIKKIDKQIAKYIMMNVALSRIHQEVIKTKHASAIGMITQPARSSVEGVMFSPGKANHRGTVTRNHMTRSKIVHVHINDFI